MLTSLLQVSERLISSALHFESFVAGGASGNFFDFALGDLGDILGLGLLIHVVMLSLLERGFSRAAFLLCYEACALFVKEDGVFLLGC